MMTNEEMFAIVKTCVVDTFAIDESKVELTSNLMNDLGAESLDLLDLVFRLERAFHIEIRRGEIENAIRTAVGDENFVQDGILTNAALEQLKTVLPEAQDQIKEGFRQQDIVSLFTVETFYNIVKRKLEQAKV